MWGQMRSPSPNDPALTETNPPNVFKKKKKKTNKQKKNHCNGGGGAYFFKLHVFLILSKHPPESIYI